MVNHATCMYYPFSISLLLWTFMVTVYYNNSVLLLFMNQFHVPMYQSNFSLDLIVLHLIWLSWLPISLDTKSKVFWHTCTNYSPTWWEVSMIDNFSSYTLSKSVSKLHVVSEISSYFKFMRFILDLVFMLLHESLCTL